MRNISLQTVELPEFGTAGTLPDISPDEYEKRLTQTIAVMGIKKLDYLLVFADREHFANFRFLTGLDPRFEEALLMIDKKGRRKILFGNECMNWAGRSPVAMEYELYQEFSLLGQDRSKSKTLEEIFAEFGIAAGKKIGCAYYKYYADKERHLQPLRLDMPAYITDVLRELTGGKETVVNANDILMDTATGLRNHNCLEELVRFEWASVRTSESMKRVIKHINEGSSEYEIANHYMSDGLPLSCHPMLSAGRKAATGLSSPSANRVQRGDAFTTAFGVWGALTCRAGLVAEGLGQLDETLAKFYERFCRNYFAVIVAWYETVGIGVTGGEVMKRVEEAREKSLFDFALNAGHTIHLDEWVNSPFYTNSDIKLHSGMALQMDIIPLAKMEGLAANAEDGICLADEALRNRWEKEYPESWIRIQDRREFMMNKLGIQLKPEVLPLGNMPAYYAPYLLSNRLVAVAEK